MADNAIVIFFDKIKISTRRRQTRSLLAYRNGLCLARQRDRSLVKYDPHGLVIDHAAGREPYHSFTRRITYFLVWICTAQILQNLFFFPSSGGWREIKLNPYTTGNPFSGTKLLGFRIGRGSGALKGLSSPHFHVF